MLGEPPTGSWRQRRHPLYQHPAGWKLKKEYLPDGWMCLVCGAAEGQELPENFVKLPKDVYTHDLIAASDCMLGKIGYGTSSEALAYKYFQCGVEMIRRDLLTGHWAPYMERALTLKPCYVAGTNGGEVAAKVLQDTAFGKNHTPCKLSGPRRLRDAIVLGYQLQRDPGKDISVPEWYTLAQNELNIRTPSPDNNTIQSNSVIKETEDFEILHGDHHGLPDTIAFLKNLAELHALNNPGNRSKQHSREQLAVAALFNWEERLAALEECCDLGQGFQLAERDMVIRGFGNIFGELKTEGVGNLKLALGTRVVAISF